jgi:hypothetical protein
MLCFGLQNNVVGLLFVKDLIFIDPDDGKQYMLLPKEACLTAWLGLTSLLRLFPPKKLEWLTLSTSLGVRFMWLGSMISWGM